MPYKAGIIFIFLLFSGISQAQNAMLEQLERKVESAPADSNKVLTLIELASAYLDVDNNKASVVAKDAQVLAEQLNYKRGLARVQELVGWISLRKGIYDKAFEFSLEALKASEKNNDNITAANCLNTIAAIYLEQKRYDEALLKYKRAYAVSKSINDIGSMGRTYSNIAITFLRQELIDSAEWYVQRALAYNIQSKDSYRIGAAIRTQADIHVRRGNNQYALKEYNRCLQLADSTGNTHLKTSTLWRIGDVYNKLGLPKRALPYLIENLALTKKYDYKGELEKTYKCISEAYKIQNNLAQAFLFQTKYIQLHDSLNDWKNAQQIAVMQIKLDTEIKQDQIDLLTQDAQLKAKEIVSQKVWKYIYVGFVILLIMVAFFLFYHNRRFSRVNEQLQERNNQVKRQAQQLRHLNSTKDKLFSIISHDLRSPLASLKGLMEVISDNRLSQHEFLAIAGTLKRNLDLVYDDLENLLLWAQSQLNNGIQAIPESINLKTLVDERIKLFEEVAKNKSIQLINEIEERTIVNMDRNQINLIVRNLIGNAIKFNRSRGSVKIGCWDKNNSVEVYVSDTGVGMESDELNKLFTDTHFTKPGTNFEKGLGIGLMLTKEFVEKNGGSIRVVSEAGKGSTFMFTVKRIPLPVL